LIRFYFKKEPEKLSVKKWAKLYQEALWLRFDTMKTQAEMMSSMFGK